MPSRPVLAAILLLPVAEVLAVAGAAHLIGGWWTFALLLASAALGGWIVRRAGRRAWRALQDAARTGALPDREVGDAALVMTGGLLLLTPGFVTDVLGALVVLPWTRPLVRRAFLSWASRRAGALPRPAPFGGAFPPGFGPSAGDAPRGPVVRGEVIRDDPPTDGGLPARP
ncbi:FxsA family protein [Actinomadura rayongensis]|uniref:FxsA family protein n=1 Tax=Actinomadura rayongensis TaxID=1429076 RepID=A0A6I4WL24_9ACTN|nr:FxsA family protein [Actinomadura rayongensis]MXQ67312.1 FxsA family protein [Actinomadura rayongensis]